MGDGTQRAVERGLDRLPVGVVHLDAAGTILSANRAAGQLVGHAPADCVGRSLFEFSAESPERAVGLLSFGVDVHGVPMGPVHVRYHHADGSVRHGDLWAENHLDDPGLGAIVMVLVPESSASSIAMAQSSVLEGTSVDTTLELLATSLGANPFVAAGCWLVSGESGRRLVGADGLPESVQVALMAPGRWWSMLDQAELVEVPDVATETDDHNRLLHAAGVRAWWLQPVAKGITGSGDAGVIVTRSVPGAISPNQAEHLGQIVTTAGLALERAMLQERLSHAAFHDSLTGLANRERFFDRSTRTLHADSALLYVDLDGFKMVNDRHGHSVGDLVLVTVADRLRKAVRPGDRITRMGGDEFVVECAGVLDHAEAISVAQRIIDAVQRPIVVNDLTVEVGASVGIAHSTNEVPIDALLEQSDAALYTAKAAGRGCWHMAGPVNEAPEPRPSAPSRPGGDPPRHAA